MRDQKQDVADIEEFVKSVGPKLEHRAGDDICGGTCPGCADLLSC